MKGRWAPAIKTAGTWLGISLLVVQPLFFVGFWHKTQWAVDMPELSFLADQVSAGESPYRPWPGYGPDFFTGGYVFPPDRCPYPPFIGAFFSFLPDWVFTAHVWWLVLTGAFWAYAAILARLAGGGFFVWAYILALVPGTWRGVVFGNIDPLLWVGFGAAMAYPRIRGAALAAVALVKPYAGWPLLFAAARDRRPVVLSAAGLVVAAFALTAAVMGPQAMLGSLVDWVHYIPPLLSQGAFIPWNVSLSFLPVRIARWAGWLQYSSGPLGPGWTLSLTVAGIAGPLVAGLLTRKLERRLHYTITMAAAVLFAPLAWGHYLPFLLAPLAVYVGVRGAATSGTTDTEETALPD